VIIILLRLTNETGYSIQLLEILVQFATPDEWKNLEQDAASLYPITFRERPHELLQGEFTGGGITINIPDLLDLPFYDNRVMQEMRPAILGGGYLPAKYQLPEQERLPLVNFTEWLLATIAHEIHHAYLHWIDPASYVHAIEPLSPAEAQQEKECERYAIRIVKKWRAEHGEGDLPFAQLEGIEKRVAEENRRIDECQNRFNEYVDGLTKEASE
jgi:hypothetical protein